MKKLFSIALVIAMAISCLAIFPSAAMSEDSYLDITYKFDGDILTITAAGAATFLDDAERLEYAVMEFYMSYNSADVEPIAESVVFTGSKTADDAFASYVEADMFGINMVNIPYDANGYAAWSASISFKVLAAPGTAMKFIDEATAAACGDNYLYVEGDEWAYDEDTGYNYTMITVPAAEDSETETETPDPVYENPAPAKVQELAGCEVCKTEAGVRFIATVSADADVYGMYISANGKDVTLSSTDADFKVKSADADTITFTAVIFSDLTFTVEVFERYGDVEVKSEAGTN